MSESPATPLEEDAPAAAGRAGYAPYGQLVKMLLPSVGSIAIYDVAGELVWCSDGYERPDLRKLLDELRASETVAGRGRVENTAAGVPAFVAGLKSEDGAPLGSLVIELSRGQNSRYSGSLVASLLRPVLDCLESRMNLERTVLAAEPDDDGSLDLLLSVDENDREDSSALEQLLRHCVEHLGCVLGALLVPDKNLAISCAVDPSLPGSQVLDRTQRHLLAWVQLNNRPMVVNRVAGSAEVAPYKILSCPIRDPNDRVTGLVALFRSAEADDFELRDVRILEFVSRKAVGILSSQYDPLTGLVNRLIFERRAQKQLDAGNGGGALLYADVDRLQTINEAFGFHAGDEVIQRIGEIVRRCAGPERLVSRIGGDRFALLLPERGVAEALEIGKRLLAAASHLGYVDGAESLPVSVSIGVAAAEHETIAHLLASAELACKRAKQQGRNRIESSDLGGGVTLLRSRQLVAAASLQDALRSNEFRLEAQPIIGLRTRSGETVGYELLVRMRGPAGELLAPDKFLDAADRYHFLPALDRWVLCSAIDVLRSPGFELAEQPCFTVNVSAQSLASGKYAAFALEQLASASLPPAWFCFEIKESAAMNHLAGAEQLIRELSKAGCKLALDDFGCGLSSLAHLKRLPVNYLKIDGRFVRRVIDDRIAESIVSGIAKAARTLGVSAIAEHVESGAIAERLFDLDVEYGQGFHLGRPQPFAKPAASPALVSPARTTAS
jgi:diguanylate cyclase (GGDEF)-like protein